MTNPRLKAEMDRVLARLEEEGRHEEMAQLQAERPTLDAEAIRRLTEAAEAEACFDLADWLSGL
jgi:hypothetical protein